MKSICFILITLVYSSLIFAQSYATLDPSNTSPNIVLYNANLTARSLGGQGSSKSTIGKSSGKWYWEIRIDSVSQTNAKAQRNGVAEAQANINKFTGSDSFGFAYVSETGNRYTDNRGVHYGNVYGAGDIIGVLLDMDTKTVSFWKNCISQGIAFTGLNGTFFASVSGGGNDILGIRTANFGSSPFVCSVPNGANAGLF